MRRRLVRFCDVVVAAAWILGSASFVASETTAVFEELRLFAGIENTAVAAPVAALVASLEAFLGVSLLSSGRHRFLSIATLILFCIVLVARGSTLGWEIRCHCFGAIASQSVVAALGRNTVLLAVASVAGVADTGPT